MTTCKNAAFPTRGAPVVDPSEATRQCLVGSEAQAGAQHGIQQGGLESLIHALHALRPAPPSRWLIVSRKSTSPTNIKGFF